ncbi:photoactive yellow protein [Fibrivirga algicola]|uniref:Photoactive yellow protein n=1 Tax=Fibrivirga algicola TaxID=2950420 RepID=A0ABX0QQV9_9BACT|nr:photoactive yellow protein [Fibrivirga algicola]ARK11567.1 photoactive yellow protein [Fibrella sp. ES10-3-2-2]NID12569.1 photoactive yellow protein [Fibrivirga algicola]
MIKLVDFSDPKLLDWLDTQTDDQLDEVPFGIVRMTHEGVVAGYYKSESHITGITREYAMGKYYFTQVAPCANNMMVAAKYAQPELDEELDYILTYVCDPIRVRLRLLKSPYSKFQYFLVKIF